MVRHEIQVIEVLEDSICYHLKPLYSAVLGIVTRGIFYAAFLHGFQYGNKPPDLRVLGVCYTRKP